MLPVARHAPGEHARHAATDVNVAPPAEKVPDGHAFVVPEDWPATQKWPAGHAAAFAVTEPDAQK